MKRFAFKLQTLLDHRKTIEDIRLMELARLRMGEQELAARLEVLRAERDRAWQTLFDLVVRGSDVWKLERADEHCRAVGDEVRLQEITLIAARKRVRGKLQEVIEASRDRKLMEQLRDQRRREYEVEAARVEQRELDDMASIRYARDRR